MQLSTPAITVVIFGAKAHTAVNESDAKLLLTGSAGVAEQPGTFGKGWLMVEQLASDTMTTCSKFLSLQLRLTNPLTATKEMRRKYFISPVLVAAGFLAGGLELLPEVEANCPATHGFNDWEFRFDSFPMAVVEAKLHQLHRHKGQLFSGMAASRHQFCVQNFGATEANSSLMAEVPVCGILTNAAQYQIFRYDPRTSTAILTSEVFDIPVKANMD